MTIPVLSEHAEQCAFVEQVRYEYRNRADFIAELFYSVPNGMFLGGTGPARFSLMNKYKREGLNPGVADLHYDGPRGGYHKFVCEMKRADKRGTKNGGLSAEQQASLSAARKAGAFVCVVYSAEEAMEKFSEYMGMEE